MSRSTIVLTVFVFLLSLIPQFWFPGKSILLGYDNVYPLNPVAFLQDRLYSWTSTQGFEVDQSAIQGSLVIHFIDALPLLLGFSPQVSQRIVTSLWFFLLLLSPYLFIRTLEKNGFITNVYIRYYFPVLYAINFYVLQAWWIFERTKFSLIVATPLILALMVPLLKGKVTFLRALKASLLSGAVLTVFNGGGWAGISLFGGLLVSLGSLFAVFAFFFLKDRRYKELLHVFASVLMTALFFLMFNAYFLLPFLSTTFLEYTSLLTRSGGIGGVVGWTRYISEHTGFMNLLRLQGIPDWYNTQHHPYSSLYLQNPFVILVSFLFPLLLLLGIRVIRKNGIMIIFFFLLLLLSLFFTAGIHAPFGGLFEFLLLHVPGFVIFRSSFFKFGYSFWLASGFLIAIGLAAITLWISKRFGAGKSPSVAIGSIVTVFFISLLVLYNFPFLKGDFFRVDKPGSIGSRVEIPEYVPEFANWWQANRNGGRVLLLPRLNEDWYFELFEWKYLSLNPILANYGVEGAIENAVLLTSDERKVLNLLYDAINQKDEEAINVLTDVFGIEYFLVRNDFAYRFEERETDNPKEIARKLESLPFITKVKEFGKWELYRISGKKSLFSTQSTAVVSPTNEDAFRFSSSNPLQLSSAENIDRRLIDATVIYPTCVSCQGEREQVPVVFPKPKILLGSNLYEILLLRERLQNRKVLTFDEQVYKDVGESLKYAGQITEIIKGDKGDSLVNLAREKYSDSLSSLGEKTGSILKESGNPYSMISILRQYLDAEKKYLEELTLQINRKEQQANLEVILEKIAKVQEDLDSLFSEQDINRKKVYRFSVVEPGSYLITIQRSSLGAITPSDLSTASLQISEKSVINPSEITDDVLNFGEVDLTTGDHTFTLFLPSQQNILTSPKVERHAGKVCNSSYISNYKNGRVYQVEYGVKNNFDPNLFFFVDDATEYAPKLLEYYSVSGEQVLSRKFVISEQTVPRDKTATTLRVAFCAPSLTQDLYAQNIKSLAMYELTTPVISFVKTAGSKLTNPPEIRVERKSPTSFKISVEEAETPFFLVHSSRFSTGWRASEGVQMVGNGFQNVWYIERKNSFDINISYTPQRYVVIGGIISALSLIGGFFLYLYIRRKEKHSL